MFSQNRPATLTSSLIILGIVYLFYVWDRMVIAITLVEVRKAFSLSLPQGGLLATVFTLGITLGAFAAGLLVTRYGPKRMLVLGAVIFSACTLWSGGAPDFTWMMASRIGGGLGEALFNVALFSFLATRSGSNRGAAAGFPATMFGIGIFLGPNVIASFLLLTGHWRGPFIILAIAGGMGALVLAAFLPHDAQQTNIASRKLNVSRLHKLLTSQLIVILFIVAVNGIAVYSFIGLFTTFLREDRHLSLQLASLILSLFGVGQIIGGVPMGYLADRVGRRPYMVIAAVITGLAAMLVFGKFSFPLVAASALVFGLGSNSMYTNCMALGHECVESQDVPLVTGFINTIFFLTAAFSGWILASIKDAIGWQMSGIVLYGLPLIACALLLLLLSGIDAGRLQKGISS